MSRLAMLRDMAAIHPTPQAAKRREAYTAALRLVRQIDAGLRNGEKQKICVMGPAIYRRRSDGRLLSHLDEVVNAILEDDLCLTQ